MSDAQVLIEYDFLKAQQMIEIYRLDIDINSFLHIVYWNSLLNLHNICMLRYAKIFAFIQ